MSEAPLRPPAPWGNVDRQLAPIRRYLRNMPRTQTWAVVGAIAGGLWWMSHSNNVEVQATAMPIYKRQLQQTGIWTRWQLPREAKCTLPTKYI